jgi:hypothetical protein
LATHQPHNNGFLTSPGLNLIKLLGTYLGSQVNGARRLKVL